ncbi:hypothetical protein IMCC3317_08220 [Kordia antarctica]|uniref:RDD domain-containing protein n=1 Tax=Kordia antarctica TaxID=1218801 RepID=A0A7L4ZGU5_9FLAO|nr:RDD family protein [Kordia antarctica]QHI35476.1 hypothetical protein IMCC3317_08220 [Kordia antarctica]
MKGIDKSVRLANFLIDITIILIISVILMIASALFGSSERSFLYLILFFYYLILEATTGQTIGKMLTNTKVVHTDGSKASFIRICMRSLLRIFPLDMFTYLFGKEYGLHDLLSGTTLMKKENDL